MKKPVEDFEKDNAFLLSKFDEITGTIENKKALAKSLEKQIVGLNYSAEKLNSEIEELKKNNASLRSENRDLKAKLENLERIMPQNFNIKNKIARIVSDIEDKEQNPNELRDMLGLLIDEIEYCINQLEK